MDSRAPARGIGLPMHHIPIFLGRCANGVGPITIWQSYDAKLLRSSEMAGNISLYSRGGRGDRAPLLSIGHREREEV